MKYYDMKYYDIIRSLIMRRNKESRSLKTNGQMLYFSAILSVFNRTNDENQTVRGSDDF